MNAPRVSILVILYQGRRYIGRCLDSLRRHAHPSQEILVVDNASTDGGPQWVAEHHPQVQRIRSETNLGYAGGINLGLRHARGQLIAPLNADTEVEAGWLDALVDHLDAEPGVGAVTPLLVIDQDRTRVNALGGAIHPSGISFCQGMGQDRARVPTLPFSVPGVSGAAYVIRRSLLVAMDGAPAYCFMGNDDVILSWILRMMGHDIQCVPGAVVYHRYNLTLDAQKLQILERNRWIHLITALERGTALRRWPRMALLEAMIGGYCLIRGPAFIRAKVRAMATALASPTALGEERARLQSLRRVSDRALFEQLSPGLEWHQLLSLLGRGRPREDSL